MSALLQKGVLVETRPGETVRSFALRVLSIDSDTFEDEVKTLILNNGCVDDPGTQELVTGDTLVFSGAMPGLVGAMLRSNSPIKVMRQDISGSGDLRDPTVPESMVRLKLFNTILRDHKKDLLDCGFYIDEDEN